MKRAYWFLLLFGIWCIASAIWYMFAVKGIPTDLAYFQPHPRLLAIAEVLSMLLVACLLGYGIAWALRDGTIETLKEANEQIEVEKAHLTKTKSLDEAQLVAIRQQWSHEEQKFAEVSSKATDLENSLRNEITELKAQIEQVNYSHRDQAILDQLESEAQSLRLKTRQLELSNEELESSILELKRQLQTAASHSTHVESMHPFVRAITSDEKDDLTAIKGIGPFIEKRLNMLGIYSLRQISEFTPDTMEQIAKAIEFFPKRMIKDNWVGQAKTLLGE